jgi:putative oxidoreductase
MKLGITAMRAAVGAVFFAHGTQKLFGWFGGGGLEGTAKGFDAMGLKPGKRTALVAGVCEAGGGAMLAIGFLTPLASAAVIGVMNQAVRTVHWQKGFFSSNGGYEFNLVLVASAVALADLGPGEWSLDSKLGLDHSGPGWALAALGAGMAGPRLLEQLAPTLEPEPASPAAAPQSAAEAVPAQA